MAETLKELRLLNIGGVDYNVGFSTNDLTNALKQAYDKAVTDSADALTAFDGLTIAKIETGLDANVREAYQLHDKDGNALGETIKVYKDSALQDVVLEDQKLKFTYNLVDGTSKTEEVDLSLFLAQAEFKNGLAVNENGEVNVALGTSGTDKGTKNFLEMEGDVEGEKVLAVRDMDANVTKVTEDIPVAGGPLASLLNNAGITKITADTDLQSLLLSLFTKEVYPTPSYTQANLVSKVTAPTITMATTTVEVGTTVEYTVKNGASSYTNTPYKVSGLTHGYSTADNDKQEQTGTSITATASNVSVASDTVKMTVVENGTTSTVDGTSAAASAVKEDSIVALEGTNTVKAKATSATYKTTFNSLASYFYCSNLKKTDASKKTTAYTGVEKTSTSVTSSETTKSFTGAFKWFIGYASSVPTTQTNLNSISAFSGWSASNGWITKDAGNTISTGGTLPGGNNMIIAVPVAYKLKDIRNGMDLESIGSFATTQVDYVLADGKHVMYNVYAFKSGSDWNFGKIVITKA